MVAGASGGGNQTAGGLGRVVPTPKTTCQANGANTATSLQDTTKTWFTNEFANRQITITAGLGAGQVRTVAAAPNANNGTTVNITAPWTTVPDSTSTYLVRSDILGPQTTGGTAFPLLPIPQGAPSALHFLVGGAGGGGAGSSPAWMLATSIPPAGQWAPGSGGGGGGGAIAFRAGDLM